MSSPALEAFLARLYTEDAMLAGFLADPSPILARSGLSETERAVLREIDRSGLVLAARSFRAKRAQHAQASKAGRVRRALAALIR
jgi:hypothetical protein